MREIKFRAWDGERMHKAFDLTQNPLFWWKDNYDYPLMQYTGLKDKNGVEIYEGDLITNHGRTNDMKLRTYQIYWSAQQARFSAKDHRAKSNTAIDDFSMEQCEVIGNLWENPEFLNDRK